jgi:hypothetical protein
VRLSVAGAVHRNSTKPEGCAENIYRILPLVQVADDSVYTTAGLGEPRALILLTISGEPVSGQDGYSSQVYRRLRR